MNKKWIITIIIAMALIAMVVAFGVSASSTQTELLAEPWHLVGSYGAAEAYQSINSLALQGKDTLRVTYDLHGLTALGNDASALIFDQDGWRYVSLSDYGQNGLDGSQTVEIPLSDFPDLNPDTEVGTLHVRFWADQEFVVDITSIVAFQNTPPACDKSDFTGVFDGNSTTITNNGTDSCWGVFAVYNTHGHASLEEGPQTLIGYRYGQIMASEAITLTVEEYDPAEGCNVQLDDMIVANEEDIPATVPDPLTQENQGAQWEALILAETHGDHVCEDDVVEKYYIPLLVKNYSTPQPERCVDKTILATLVEQGQTSEMEFGEWPGPDYGNVVLPYGKHIEFATSDGAEISSSLTWYHEDPRGDSWYHYFDPANTWDFTATFDDETSWFDLTPGHPWEIKFSYYDGPVLCNLQIDMQWDPP